MALFVLVHGAWHGAWCWERLAPELHDRAERQLFSPCDRKVAAEAVARLRVQSRTPILEPCPLETWPEVPAMYVLGTDDTTVRPAWSRRAAAERLGVEPVELDGGHALFLSHPGELAELLAQPGEYRARSGKPRRRRMRLSASSSCSRSPMSYHSPSKR